jgi:hypothetical protein
MGIYGFLSVMVLAIAMLVLYRMMDFDGKGKAKAESVKVIKSQFSEPWKDKNLIIIQLNEKVGQAEAKKIHQLREHVEKELKTDKFFVGGMQRW